LQSEAGRPERSKGIRANVNACARRPRRTYMRTIRPIKRQINDAAMAAANLMLPKDRRVDVLGDFYQAPPKKLISELSYAWGSFVVTEMGRAYYPTIRVQDGTMTLPQRFKQFNQLYRTMWRLNILVLSAFCI